MPLINGSFEVKLSPQAGDDGSADFLGRLTIDKRFHGDLDATSRGVMLASQAGVKGSAGYVAIERVTGSLLGRAGSFVLQHFGLMDRGVPSLTVSVVPDSGTGELAGLSGHMTIDITGGDHQFTFEYSLDAK